tara:strand:+ start:172 stop:666 length:495 start_codon:yes stop_codon:yes gene_type:complete
LKRAGTPLVTQTSLIENERPVFATRRRCPIILFERSENKTPNTLKSSIENYKFIIIFYNQIMYKLITSSTDSKENAQVIANTLISKLLSPCVQIISNVESLYIWNGEIENTSEYLILIKCCQTKEEEIVSKILDLHKYEVPEIIVSNFDILNPDYKSWFDKNSI